MSFTDVIANPPTDVAGWDRINRREHNLHLKWPRRIRQMHWMHKEKAVRVNQDRLDHIKFPGAFVMPLVKSGMRGVEARAQVAADLVRLEEKTKHLRAIMKCCRVELEIRDHLFADGRHPVEPDEPDTLDERELDVEPATITSIDSTITRDLIG